jgi:TRAP-type C4-dicarboxylate transport system substrate-binding protein
LTKLWIVIACWFGLACTAHAQDNYVLKFATLAPQGSTWMNIISDWAKQVDADSQGRLRFKIYPGGVSGDEPDVLRKIRFGQLQGAAFTGHGIGHVYSPARIFEIPYLFHDAQEIDAVRAQFMPEIEAGFRSNGYELLGWMEVGFLRFFSKKPLHTLDDLKSARIWLWQGDPMGIAFFNASGISPVPLALTDVYTSLSTGLIDTTIAPPLGAIALQWFTKTPYMSEIVLSDGIGGLLVSREFFAKLPPDLQALLQKTGKQASARLISETRRDNEKSLAVLRQNGVKPMLAWKDVVQNQLYALRDRASADLVKSGYLPAPMVERVNRAITAYRSSKK